MRCWRNFKRPAACLLLALSLPGGAANALTPPPGSPLRVAVIDAVKTQLGIHGKFKVARIEVAGDWAYFEGTEIVPLQAGEWQETDQTVNAVLQKTEGGWRTALLWSLTRDHEYPRARFESDLRELRQTRSLPEVLFE